MKLIEIIAILALLLSCGRFASEKSQDHDTTQVELLRQKFEKYKNLTMTVADADGFIQTDECDALLFSALYGTVTQVNITAARDQEGKWHRRPLSYPECYPSGSPSTISRDMFIGVFWYIWKNKRLDLALDIFSYGQSHDWIMGYGDFFRTYMVPGMQATLAEIIHRLGGPDYAVYRSIPQAYTKNINYAAHLDMLHILLREELTGTISLQEKEIIDYNYKRVPGNPLYSFIFHKINTGNYTETISQLLNESAWPANRLPTSSDRCEPWVVQRDLGPDWEPCGAGKTHSGADFLFTAKLVLDRIQ